VADETSRTAIRNLDRGRSRAAAGAEPESELEDRVIRIDRTRKTVKGGRISSSRVVVAIGDGHGNVGLGIGKARNVPDGIAKAVSRARKNMIRIPMDGYTIPHEITAKVGGAVILLKPASRGTGIIAGGATRQLIEVSGIRDILTKSLGSGNVLNRAKACFAALQSLRDPRVVAGERGKTVHELIGRDVVDPYVVVGEESAERQAFRASSELLEEELDKVEVEEE
jgi:small subunit ribosomal protein S5